MNQWNVYRDKKGQLLKQSDRAGNNASWTKTRLVDTDDLPDYYEVNVTGTDPLDGDSDSSRTPENEAGNGITDDIEDPDSTHSPKVNKTYIV